MHMRAGRLARFHPNRASSSDLLRQVEQSRRVQPDASAHRQQPFSACRSREQQADPSGGIPSFLHVSDRKRPRHFPCLRTEKTSALPARARAALPSLASLVLPPDFVLSEVAAICSGGFSQGIFEMNTADDTAFALRILEDNFDNNSPRRFVEGVAVSGSQTDSNGNRIFAQGAKQIGLVPLLWSHDWLLPLGVVRSIASRGETLAFTAEIVNTGRLAWANTAWEFISQSHVKSVSVLALNLSPSPRSSVFANWRVGEISIVQVGADPGARLSSVWEQDCVARLNRPMSRVIWSARD